MTKSSQFLSSLKTDLATLCCSKAGITLKVHDVVSSVRVGSPVPWKIDGDVPCRKRMIILSLNDRIAYGILSHEYQVDTHLMVYIEKIDSCGMAEPIQFGIMMKDQDQAEATSLLKYAIQSYLKCLVSEWVGNVSIHVFARSQPEFLFNGSQNLSCKHVLSHTNLIKWWKNVLSFDMKGYRTDYQIYVPNGESSAFGIQGSNWKWQFPYLDNDMITKSIPLFPDDAKARLVRERIEDGSANVMAVKEFREYLGVCQDFCNGNVAAFLHVKVEQGDRQEAKVDARLTVASAIPAETEIDNVVIIDEKLVTLHWDNEELVQSSSAKLIKDLDAFEFKVPQCTSIEKKKVVPVVTKTVNVVSGLLIKRKSSTTTASDGSKKQKT